jgi:adenosylcobinamide-phosphate synthase
VIGLVLVAQRSLHDRVASVGARLAAGDLAGARVAGRGDRRARPESLDAAGVARAAIESLFENFADGCGRAGVLGTCCSACRGCARSTAVNTLDSMLGHLDERHRDFGATAARIDTAAMFVPARLAGAILAAAAVRAARRRSARRGRGDAA